MNELDFNHLLRLEMTAMFGLAPDREAAILSRIHLEQRQSEATWSAFRRLMIGMAAQYRTALTVR